MTSRHERWVLLRRRLWQPPRPHGAQPQDRGAEPLELFYDLVVVVLVAQAAHHFAGHLTWHGLAEFALASLALGALRPAPLILGLVLVALLGIPWLFAVVRRLSTEVEPDAEINHL
ncbi:low temperature requirement protein A [Streptomyces sp. NPDC055144]